MIQYNRAIQIGRLSNPLKCDEHPDGGAQTLPACHGGSPRDRHWHGLKVICYSTRAIFYALKRNERSGAAEGRQRSSPRLIDDDGDGGGVETERE